MHPDFSHTADKLEFRQVLEIIASYSRSERSRESIRSLVPCENPEEAASNRSKIMELRRLAESEGSLPIGGWQDSFELLSRAAIEGQVYTGEELVAIAAAEKKAAEIKSFLASKVELLPLVSCNADSLTVHEDFFRRVEQTIEKDFEVADSASPRLMQLRREISSLRSKLRKSLGEFAERVGKGKGHEFVTIRGERYVVSLPRNEALRMRGVVHQASASGASLFIEPLEFVDDNNRLESLLDDERAEVARILAELSREVMIHRESMIENQNVLRDLDCLVSEAEFARRFRCISPDRAKGSELVLVDARHPLLEKKLSEQDSGRSLTPLDIRCDDDLKVLVISGPNAGGKTVALKTIGLLVLMDSAGLCTPCSEGSAIPRYDSIFVDIGDDQSIEASLSTFSSRVLRLRTIVECADQNSLVLIDEIGDGTDPEEGAALAQAALEHLMARCGRIVVTTHLTALKGWAHRTPGAMNATLEFDSQKLEPLFTLKMGVPGRSWGIEVASRMGLGPSIVDSARARMGVEALRLEELLAHLEKAERLAEAERRELERRERLLAELLENYRERLDSIKKHREDLLAEARKEALDIVKSARRDLEALVKEIRAAGADRATVHSAKEKIEERKKTLERDLSRRASPSLPFASEEVKPGVRARIASLGKEGTVSNVNGSRITVELEGGMRVETNIGDLEHPGSARQEKRVASISWTVESREPVAPEISIRGLERDEALERVDAFLDRAVLQGLKTVVIIHGIGRGILKRAVYDMLRKDPRVMDVHPGEPALGGDGVAVVNLK